jgi:hypothetical protein
MVDIMIAKDPNSVEPYFIVWCSENNTNDGTTNDTGELQGATIATANWTLPAGITEDSSNTGAVTIAGITYAANTVATIWLSGGTDGENYILLCRITTSDGRTLDKSIEIPVRSE